MNDFRHLDADAKRRLISILILGSFFLSSCAGSVSAKAETRLEGITLETSKTKVEPVPDTTPSPVITRRPTETKEFEIIGEKTATSTSSPVSDETSAVIIEPEDQEIIGVGTVKKEFRNITIPEEAIDCGFGPSGITNDFGDGRKMVCSPFGFPYYYAGDKPPVIGELESITFDENGKEMKLFRQADWEWAGKKWAKSGGNTEYIFKNGCGLAVLASLFDYYAPDKGWDPIKVSKEYFPEVAGGGLNKWQLERAIKGEGIGYSEIRYASWQDVEAEISKGRIVVMIVPVDLRFSRPQHIIMVIGKSEKGLVIYDPIYGVGVTDPDDVYMGENIGVFSMAR